jgi:hypothetical protein
MRTRAGAALVEVLIAAVLLAIVAAAGATLLRAQSRIANDVTVRSERNDASRSALLTLQAELRHIAPRTDLRAIARDSIAARIFRGVAVVCGHRDSLTLVRYRGLRMPDARKDSALQVGVENVAAIENVATHQAMCTAAPGEEILAINLAPRAPDNSMWLVFESGSYHLSSHALRYRRGAESRQPITNEIIDVRRSGFDFTQDSLIRSIEVTLTDRRTEMTAIAVIPMRGS